VADRGGAKPRRAAGRAGGRPGARCAALSPACRAGGGAAQDRARRAEQDSGGHVHVPRRGDHAHGRRGGGRRDGRSRADRRVQRGQLCGLGLRPAGPAGAGRGNGQAGAGAGAQGLCLGRQPGAARHAGDPARGDRRQPPRHSHGGEMTTPNETASTAPKPVALSPAWRTALVLLAVVVAVWLLIFHESLWSMVEIWSRSDTFGHGFLIAPIVAYLILQRRAVLARLSPAPALWALVAVAGSVLLWFVARVTGVAAAEQFAA